LVGSRKQRQTLESVRAYVGLNWRDDRSILFGVYIDGALRGPSGSTTSTTPARP